MHAPHLWKAVVVGLAIALAGPPVANAQGLDPDALEGNWVRVGSNYDPNDQMRIEITRGQATVTRVPKGVHASYKVGLAVWMGIERNGNLRVYGSDRTYYAGKLTLKGDELTLSVSHDGAGNYQTWRRAGPTVDGEWVRIAPGVSAADGMKVLADQDQGAVRYLPAAAPRVLRIGSRLWRDIGARGAVQVMGGDGRYEPATIRLEGDDRLWVERTGQISELWVRPEIVTIARAEAGNSSGTTAVAACVASSLPELETRLTSGWALAVSDRQTATAERIGVLDYRGDVPSRALVTDVERFNLPGIDPGFSRVWQQVRPRTRSEEYTDLTAAEFTSRNDSSRTAGLMLNDIEAYTTPQGLRYAGVWMSNLEGVDWDASHGLTSTEFGQQFQQKSTDGFRLTDIEVYQTAAGLRYAAIWLRSCDNDNWREVRGMTRDDYQRRTDSLGVLGFKVVDFESYRTPSGQRYAAIWEQVPGLAWAVRTDRNLVWFLNNHREFTDQGFRLVDFESYETENGTRYAGVWAENDPRYRLAFRTQLDDSVKDYRVQQRLPGLSVAIIHRGELIYSRGFGWADSAGVKEAFSGTVYPMASISKAIGGTLAARLEARGVIDLTRPTRDYVDSLSERHTHTLEQLLAKTGCVVHYDEGPEPPGQYYRWRRDALRAVSAPIAAPAAILRNWMLPNCTPGQSWHYSTHGFTLVGAALEKATGKDIVQLIDEEIAGPMGLRTLRLQQPWDTAQTRPTGSYYLSQPYTMDSSMTGVQPKPSLLSQHEDPSWKVLGGGLRISAPDLARFGELTLNGGAVSDSVRDNRLWRVLTTGLPPWDTTVSTRSTALAWEVRTVNSRMVAEHGGSAGGARSHLAVFRDNAAEGLVVVILSNQRQGPGTSAHPVSALAHRLANIVLTPPPP